MEYVQLGNAGVKVSRLGLGTMNFGPLTPEPECHRLLDAAVDLGINFVDTADIYGWKSGEGLTENIVGQWLRRPGVRHRVVLATKVYGAMGEGPNNAGLSAYHIHRACDASLRRLQTDCVDLYQLHHPDPVVDTWEAHQALVALTRQGKILYAGTSNFPAWQIASLKQRAANRGEPSVVSEQSRYNLQTRSIELEVLPACRHFGMGVIAWAPLAGGVLAGPASSSHGRRAGERAQAVAMKHRSQLDGYFELCRQLQEDPAVVAVAWLLSRPDVSSCLLGPRTVAQLRSIVRASEIRLDETALAALDHIWPGPGEAPSAYAW